MVGSFVFPERVTSAVRCFAKLTQRGGKTRIMNLSSQPKLKKAKHRKYVYALMAILAFDYILFPLPILAQEESSGKSYSPSAEYRSEEAVQQVKLVPKPQPKVKSLGYRTMTAYTSEAAQTDSTPCITANGFNVCEHGVEDTVAANFLKFGTKVRIPELYGDRVFVVRDRMNARHAERVDIWMKEKPAALKFGVRTAKIEVVE